MASMLEIYNETIRDLLWRPSKEEPARSENDTPAKQYIVKHVSDLTLVDFTNWKEVCWEDAMNEQSSRIHCVFTLRITGTNESTEQQVHGVLNLIDLAGSKRLSRSCSTGDRLKETPRFQAINKSLSSLQLEMSYLPLVTRSSIIPIGTQN